MNDSLKHILNKYDINYNIISADVKIPISYLSALGIGDILISIVLLQNKLINAPIYINLIYFNDTSWYPKPENALEFRINLINFLINIKCINITDIKYIYYENRDLDQRQRYFISLPNMKLNYTLSNNRYINSKYIVFHTKCRFFKDFDYFYFKNILKQFYNNIITKYDIIILGEKNFPNTIEVTHHGITTIYNELLSLKNNNNVIDLTYDSIYNNLDIDNYKNDINIIINAEYNILVGYGGQLCSCLAFNFDNTITYVDRYFENWHNNLQSKLFINIISYLNKINSILNN